ncbi:MAG: ABC transporter ATP-binding protein [Chloroflexi bacterium]|nr:ABC transporter ATP-binding protein [Chloroflexota bacterium]
MDIALQAQSLVKTYVAGGRAVIAVDDVSFELQSGEFLALVGPSGSGKTTLLALLAGLLVPDTGEVLVEGQALSAMSERRRAAFRRRRIGFAFQSNNLVPYLTALENVELMLRLNGKRDRGGRQRARELLVRLGLEERLNALPRQLSGGQQQRVAIARALIHRPTLVLADEPTASLDTERAYQVVETLADLVHLEGRAAIMVTHDLRMIEHCDRVVQLLDGKIKRVLDAREDLACLANPANCAKIPLSLLGPS